MTVWQFFAAWLLLLVLCIGLSVVWSWLRSLSHPFNASLDTVFAGRRRMLEYAIVVGLALLMTWGVWEAARPWWSEPVAPINPAKPVVVKLHPDRG
jgi:hypothetical protein